MTRIRFVTLHAMLLPLCLLLSAVLAQAEEVTPETTPRWEVSQQRQLGSELYQTAFLPESKATVAVTREQVLTVDEGGQVATAIKLSAGQRANLSVDGKFASVMTSKREFIDLFELKAMDGKVVTAIEPVGSFVSFMVGKDAQMVVGVEVEVQPESLKVPFTYHFYDRDGKEIGQTKTADRSKASFAPDGKAFVVNDSQGGLSAFSQDGSKVWGVAESYRSFDVSDSARRVIASSASEPDRVVLLENGERLGDNRFENRVLKVAISPDGESVAATDIRTIRSFANSLEGVWEHTFGDQSLMITSIAVSDNGLAACGVLKDNGPEAPPDNRYTEGQALLFDETGNVIWQQKYSLTLANAWIPAVALTPVGENETVVTVRTREKLFSYRIAR